MMADNRPTLDGLGFLGATAPAPCAFSLLKAQVVTERGADTLHVLVISTQVGAHVTYWSEESLRSLRDQLTEALSGVVIAQAMPGATELPRDGR